MALCALLLFVGMQPVEAENGGSADSANAAPAFPAASLTRAVDENSSAGTAVGDAVSATDEDDVVLSYALAGADAARFAIDTASGQITVGSGTVLDHEAQASYALSVEVRDGRDADGDPAPQEPADATVSVTVNVGDVAEPPPEPTGLTVTAATATGLTLSWSAPDTSGRPPLTGYVVRYRLSGGTWNSHAHDGLTTQATISGLTPSSQYRVRVRAVNDEGRSGFAATGGSTTPVPSVSAVAISSQAGEDSAYAIGERIEVTVTFDTAVTVTGTPRLALSIGSETRQADYAAGRSGGGGTEVVFGYTVVEGDSDSDGVAVAADALSLGDGAIRSGTEDAALSHAAVAADFGHKVDGVRPRIEAAPSVTSTPSRGDGHYRSLERITLELRFSEAVTVDTTAGTPRLTVSVGANERPADYDAGTGTTLTFSWPVKPADLDTDGISVAANGLTLRGGTITDLAGNAPADLNHAALAVQSGHRVAGNRSPPRFADDTASFTIAEDHDDGELVGTVAASDADGDLLVYTLSGDDDGLFEMVTGVSGGSLSVAAGERLSYESTTAHALTVTATDPAGLSDAVSVTVNVTDVNEAPIWGTEAPTLSNKFSTSVTVSWVSPDTTDRPPVIIFELTAAELDSEGNYKIPLVIKRAFVSDGSATTGTLTGLKPSTRYDVSVAATSAEGTARSASAVFTTQPPNDAPKGYDPATCAEDASELSLSAPAGTQVELGPLHGGSSQEGGCSGSSGGQASYFWDPDGDTMSMSVAVESAPAAVWRGTIGGEQSPVIDAGGTKLQFVGLAARAATGLEAVVTANDGRGGTASRRVVITVGGFSGSAAPSFGTQVGDQAYQLGAEITSLVLPAASGGDLGHGTSGEVFDYVYALSGTLPSGLSFEERTLSGTPESWGRFAMTYTAQDADLEQGGSDTASQTFTITVPPRVRGVRYLSDPGADGTYAIGDEIRMELLLGSGGGGVSVVGSPLPQLAVQVGEEERLASYAGEAGQGVHGYGLEFRYTVTEGDADGDGVSIGANALRSNGATVATFGGVALSAEHDALPFDKVHKVDGVRPAAILATVNGDALSITFGEELDGGAEPAGSAFTVKGIGADQSPTGVSISGAEVRLTLGAGAVHSHRVTVDYEPPSSAALRDAAGNEAAGFTGRVRNDTPDQPQPEVSGASVDGTTLTLTFDEDLDTTAAPPGSVFTVSGTDASTSVTAVAFKSGDATQLELTLSPAVEYGDAGITVSYRKGSNPLKDGDGNEVADFTDHRVTNDTPAAPTASNISKSVAEDTTLTFAAADFTNAFSDADGHTLKSVKIVTLPDATHGTLKAGDPLAAVSAGATIEAADLGTITFEPVANWNGSASFTYKVTDSSDAESAAAATVTITVSAVDDRPTASNITKSTYEDTTLTFAAGDFTGAFSDPDEHALKSVKIVTLPAGTHGTLKVGTSDATAGQVVTAANLGTITFEPAMSWTGTASFTYKVTDSADQESTAAATVSITVAAGVTVTVAAGSATEGSAVTFKAKLSAAVSSDVVLDWVTGNDDTTGANQATSGTDYTAVTNGSVTITASSTEASFSVSTTEDGLAEGDETFMVTISEPSGTPLPGGVTIGTASAVGTIVDDDAAPVVSTATVSGNTLTLTFDKDLAALAPAVEKELYWAFGVRHHHLATSYVPSRATVNGPTVTLTLGTAAVAGGEVSVSYSAAVAAETGAILQDAAGNAVESFERVVTNTTPGTGRPLVTAAEVAGNALTVTFTRDLDAASRPAGSRFRVWWFPFSYDLPSTIRGTGTASVSGKQVTITLASVVSEHGNAYVIYEKGTDANPLRGVSSGPLVADIGQFPATVLDRTAPKMFSGIVAGTTLTLYYDEALDTGSEPAAGAFTVTAGGSAQTVSGVSVSRGAVTLTLSSAVADAAAVTVTYTAGTNPIRDRAGNDAANLTNKSVTNQGATDPGKPSLAATGAAVVDVLAVTFTWDQPLDPARVPGKAAFTLSDAYWGPITGVAVRGRKVELGLTWGVFPCDEFTMTYAKPGTNALRNLWGTEVDGFSQAVTNARADQCAYRFTGVMAKGSELRLGFDRALRRSEEPSANGFTVTPKGGGGATGAGDAGGTAIEVEGVRFTADGTGVVLDLSRALGGGEQVTVSYRQPRSGAGLWDADGNQVAAFSAEAEAAGAASAPGFDAGDEVTLTIAENHADGAEVGTVAASDADGDTLSYWLSGADAVHFEISGAGTITVRSGVTLDHEAQSSYAVTAAVSDGKDAAGNAEQTPTADATIAVTIEVSNVEEPPGVPTGLTVDSATATSLTVNWTAPADSGAVAVTDYDVRWYRGANDPAAEADWVEAGESGGHDHQGTATTATIPGLQPGTTYRVQVRAEGDGEGAWSASVSGRTAASRPTASDISKTVNEDTTLTFAAADFSGAFSDPDNHTLKSIEIVTLPDAAHGTLKVGTANATTGQSVAAADLGTISFEPAANWNGTASFTYKVTDSSDQESATAATVTIIVEAEASVPAVEAVAVVSDAGADATYAPGDTIRVRVSFSEAVTVDTAGGRPRLRIDMDPAAWGEKWAAYESGGGTANLTFAYAVVVPNTSTRGIAVPADTLELNGGTIRSAATQADAVLAHEGLDHDPAHQVDTTGPAFAGATVSGTALTITFDEPLDPASAPPADAFTATVDTRGTPWHRVIRGTGDVQVEGAEVRVTLATAVFHGRPVTVAYVPWPEDGGRVRDVAGNEAGVFFERQAVNATPAPAVSGTVNGRRLVLTFGSALMQGAGPAGSAFTVTAARPDGPLVRTIAGTGRAQVVGATATVTLADEVWPGDTVTVSYARPRGGPPLRYAAGSEVAEFSGEPVANETPVPAPEVRSVKVVSDAGEDEVYTEGETIEAAVLFTSAVRVEREEGVPTLALIMNGTIRRASHAPDAVRPGLVFRYAVSEADGAVSAVRVAASGLKLDGGAIVAATEDGTPALLGFGATPGVTGVTIADEPDGHWEAGDTVAVTLRFAEPVTVAGAPSVALWLGGGERRAAYARGSGSEALVFGYALVESDGGQRHVAVVEDGLSLGDGSIVSTGGGLAVALAHPAAERTLTPPPVLPR